MDITITDNICAEQKEELLQMIHLAFREHLDRGLNFTCSRYTMEDLENKVLSGKCFFAMCDARIVGVTSVSVKREDNTAYENISAVHPDFKSSGIGTKLSEARRRYLLDNGVVALVSDTSVGAKSSVRWHLKKCGCSIVGYESYSSTNYYSYIFREDLVPVSFWRKQMVYRFRFLKSFIRVRLTKHRDGRLNLLGRLLKK